MNDTRWHLFTIAGHPVYMTPSFLLIMAVFVFSGVRTSADLLPALMWAPVLFFGILWHELGHATASKAFGYGRSTILFWGLGGLAINAFQGRRTPLKSLGVSLAGPAASLILALASGGALMAYTGGFAAQDLLGEFLRLSMVANLFWAVFNMLPIYPMDGGQAVMHGVEAVTTSPRKAAVITGYLGIVAILVTVLGAKLLGWGVGVFTLLMATYFGYLNWKLTQTGRPQRWAV